MLKLQKALHGILQTREVNPHSPEKKAVPFLTVFLLSDQFSDHLGMTSISPIEGFEWLIAWTKSNFLFPVFLQYFVLLPSRSLSSQFKSLLSTLGQTIGYDLRQL